MALLALAPTLTCPPQIDLPPNRPPTDPPPTHTHPPRSDAYMLELFDKAGLEVVTSSKQRNFPKELFEVRQYALRPRGR